jgi:hypothetical protein
VDWNLVEAAGKYAGLAGIALIVFLFVTHLVLRLGAFKSIGSKGALLAINNIINKVFWVTVLALLAWLAVSLFGQHNPSSGPQSATVIPAQNVDIKDIPQDLLTPVSGKLEEELKSRSSLTLNGSTLTIGQIGEDRAVTIACNTLRLMNGAKIVTNGNHLVIIALKAEFADNAGIHSFATPNAKASAGLSSADGGSVRLTVVKSFSGKLRVLLPGQDGGNGATGPQGAPGSAGSRGADAVKGLFDCRSGGQNGGTGGQGAKGGTGTTGGKGGNGGDLHLEGQAADHKSAVDFRAPGGKGGSGGAGGPGGPGGPGGQGGSGDGLCGGGHGGADGISGPQGDKGTDGSEGAIGHRTPA